MVCVWVIKISPWLRLVMLSFPENAKIGEVQYQFCAMRMNGLYISRSITATFRFKGGGGGDHMT